MEPPTRAEGKVANDLGLNPQSLLTRKEQVERITFGEVGTGL